MEIHVHLHTNPNIESKLDLILSNQGEVMATLQQLETELQNINTTTDEISADIADLLAKLAAGGMSQAETDSVLAQLAALNAKVKGIASSHDSSGGTGGTPV